MVNVIRIQRLHHSLNDVDSIFLQVIIATVGLGAGGAVVVHRQSAAKIKILQRHAVLYQSNVTLTCFFDPVAHVADIGQLRPQMKMQQTEAIQHLVLAQSINDADQFHRRQTEQAAVATVAGPMPFNFGRQFHPRPDHRANAKMFRAANY